MPLKKLTTMELFIKLNNDLNMLKTVLASRVDIVNSYEAEGDSFVASLLMRLSVSNTSRDQNDSTWSDDRFYQAQRADSKSSTAKMRSQWWQQCGKNRFHC